MLQAAARPATADTATAAGAVAGLASTFSATVEAAAAAEVVATAAVDTAFCATVAEVDAAGGLAVVLAFFFFLSKPE